ncbi:MAG: hypothetical protein LBE49_00390 [Deltaproteobacteria bacterium]|jgi:hypothetical protein|nr:hypothetical protein [Deltaproteobacteria bacterium]
MAGQNARVKTILAIAAIWVAVSAAVYLLVVNEPTSVQKQAFFYLILAEVLTAGVLAFLESRAGPDASKIGFYASVILFLLLAGAAAITHLSGAVDTSTWLHVIELFLLAVLFTVLITLWRGQLGVSGKDSLKSLEALGIHSLVGRLEAILALKRLDDPDKTILKAVIDDARFMDKGPPLPSDAKIEAKVKELESLLEPGPLSVPSGEGAPGEALGQALGRPAPGALVDELHALVTLRRKESALTKRGGF